MAGGRRDQGLELPNKGENIGLPVITFLYTLDQIATMVNLSEKRLREGYIYFEGRSVGITHKDVMIARNIAPRDKDPEWRVAEREFIRWMRFKGFRMYTRAAFR